MNVTKEMVKAALERLEKSGYVDEPDSGLELVVEEALQAALATFAGWESRGDPCPECSGGYE